SLLPGARIEFARGQLTAEVMKWMDFGGRIVRFETDGDFDDITDRIGRTPLPPYIKRDEEDRLDADSYQTVFARERGAIAAPTAGLHFTPALLDRLRAGGVEIAEITLHVGYGTFQPVRVERVEEHHVEAEAYSIGEHAAASINRALAEGRRVIAVGTTTTLALESATRRSMDEQTDRSAEEQRGGVAEGKRGRGAEEQRGGGAEGKRGRGAEEQRGGGAGERRGGVAGEERGGVAEEERGGVAEEQRGGVAEEQRCEVAEENFSAGPLPRPSAVVPAQAATSDLFIYPGFDFKVISGLITNFHLPRSSLLMLVSAFAGRERVLGAYRHAVDNEYRFYSYGDAMLIL